MVQFATVDELAEFIGRPVANQNQGDLMLQLATSAVQGEAHQQFALRLGDTVTLEKAWGPRELRLPQRPVLAVADVRVNGIQVTGYDFTRQGRVRWLLGDQFSIMDLAINAPTLEPDLSPIIQVTYSHGFALTAGDVPVPNPLGIELLPPDVKRITLSAAARAVANPEGAQQEQAAGYSVQYPPGVIELTDGEKRDLARWRPRA